MRWPDGWPERPERPALARHPGAQALDGPTGWWRCDYPDVLWLASAAPALKVLEMSDVAAIPQCDRWWPSLRLRRYCTHGLDIVPATEGGPLIQSTLTPNQYAGECFRCGLYVPAGQGRIILVNRRPRPAHRRREDCYDHDLD